MLSKYSKLIGFFACGPEADKHLHCGLVIVLLLQILTNHPSSRS